MTGGDSVTNHRHDSTVSVAPELAIRLAIATTALVLVIAGIAAVFLTATEVGAAALLAAGAVFGLVAYAGDRITRLKAGQFEADLVQVEKAVVQLKAAETLEAAGAVDVAVQLREDAVDTLRELQVVSTRYEDTRRSMPSGTERTLALQEQLAQARARAKEGTYRFQDVERMFHGTTQGARVTALAAMQEAVELRDFSAALDAIRFPRSAFEQYHGLLLARSMVGDLDNDQRRVLQAAVEQQRESTGGWIYENTAAGRWTVSGELLEDLRSVN